MPTIHTSIACNLDTNILLAALPLFQQERVEAIEWSFDALFRVEQVPDWFLELIKAYADEKRLIGHGVFFSLFSGKWYKEQEEWLHHLQKVSRQFQFQHITEHFGFMTGDNFHAGAPLSIPLTERTKLLGQDRLKRIAHACECPVGLENLAFAYSLEDVKAQGDFLDTLLEPINGFIILDLHNFYCQLYNFGLTFEELITLYPLDRVKEIHLSGGSWQDSALTPRKKVRRDTHDDAVPEEVFHLLEKVMPLCPNLGYVVLEQIGTGLKTENDRSQFRQDFERMRTLVASNEMVQQPPNSFLPNRNIEPDTPPVQDPFLHAQQLELSRILESAGDYREASSMLNASSLSDSAWGVEHWAPHMLETALKIAQKWQSGF